MDLSTNLRGRLKNTSLPLSGGLLPVFETISNAIHAIEDANIPMHQGVITLDVIRDGQASLEYGDETDSRTTAPIIAFRITDNGIGFTDDNMDSFRTLDSQYKVDRGGRGVGRLLWLKAFTRASVKSVFLKNGNAAHLRKFTFDANNGLSNVVLTGISEGTAGTCITLESFYEHYRAHVPKTSRVIASSLLAHCLWYFVRPDGAPKIVVVDQDECISLQEIYEQHVMSSSKSETIVIKEMEFDLMNVKLAESSRWDHSVAFCASSRLVKEERIEGRVPGLFGSLRDESGSFVYQCYVSSRLLDERVRSERTGFDIEEEPLQLFETAEVSFREIRDGVLERSADFLCKYLEEKRALGRERVERFVTRRAPRYRPILGRVPDEDLAVDPDMSDRDIDLLLHKHLSRIENELIQ